MSWVSETHSISGAHSILKSSNSLCLGSDWFSLTFKFTTIITMNGKERNLYQKMAPSRPLDKLRMRFECQLFLILPT